MNTFLPGGYEAPQQSSRYLRFKKEGSYPIRILGDALLGWEDWTEDKKPVRTPYTGMDSAPKPINPKRPVKHFWAFPVWDYEDTPIKNDAGEVTGYKGAVKILEVTQSTIHDTLYTLHCDKAWGNPQNYDIVIKRTGMEFNDTKYEVTPRPPTPLAEEIKKEFDTTYIDLQALMTNDDPFAEPKEVDPEEAVK